MNEPATDWDRLADAIEYPAGAPPALQEQYVETFDLDPLSTLDMGWHLFGDAPERGAWLAALRADLARAGVRETSDLPDHLPALLRLIARTDDVSASELAALLSPAVARMRDRLAAQHNPFADVIENVSRLLEMRATVRSRRD